MKLLAIETSTDHASVALAVGDKLWFEEQKSLRQHAQFLLPMIDQVVAQAGITLAELDGIAFGMGPGSFTGLRITCSIAKALAYAHELPLFPVSGLLSIAYSIIEQTPNLPSQILVMLDARMQQVYWTNFSSEALQRGEVTHTPKVSHPGDITIENASCMIAGVGFEAYLPQFSQNVQSLLKSSQVVYPHAKNLIALVQKGCISATDAHTALPLYVRNQVTQGGHHG